MGLNTRVLRSLLARGEVAVSLGGGAVLVQGPGDPVLGAEAAVLPVLPWALSHATGKWDLSVPMVPALAELCSEARWLVYSDSWHCRRNYPYFDTSQKLAVMSDGSSGGAAALLRLPLTVADDRNMRA